VAGSAQQPSLSTDEKRRLQVMRVQIRLLSLGLYDGQASGLLDGKTKQSLKLFQSLKHLPETGLMTTPTLNALGVPSVN
jgi:His-Xaa-Ser repeat protein HxsA